MSMCPSRSLKKTDGLVDGEGVFYAEDAAAAALERVQVGAAAESLSKIAGECTYISSILHSKNC